MSLIAVVLVKNNSHKLRSRVSMPVIILTHLEKDFNWDFSLTLSTTISMMEPVKSETS